MSIDLKIAYNSMRNKTIWDGLNEFAPGLRAMFRRLYGREWGLWGRNGAQLGTRFAGLSMGDPLASLLFCVGLQASLRRLEEALQRRSVAEGVVRPPDPVTEEGRRRRAVAILGSRAAAAAGPTDGGADGMLKSRVFAFADDICIYGRVPLLADFCAEVADILGEVGLVVNATKSFLVFPEETAGPQEALFPVRHNFCPMQVPVGPTAFVREQLEKRMQEARRGMEEAVKYAQPRSALALIKYSYVPRAVYPMRNSFCGGATHDILTAYRDDIAKKVAYLAQLGEDVEVRGESQVGEALGDFNLRLDKTWVKRVFLAAEHGGLGLLDTAGFNGELQRGMLRRRIQTFFNKYFPEFCPTFERIFPEETVGALQGLELEDQLAAVEPVRVPGVEEAAHLAVGGGGNGPVMPRAMSMKAACYAAIAQQVHRELRESMGEREARPALAWLTSSSAREAGRFLTWCGGPDHRTVIKAEELRIAIRLRLVPPAARDACACGGEDADPVPTEGNNGYHPLHCGIAGRLFYTARHNQITNALAAHIRAMRPDAVVAIEKGLTCEGGLEGSGPVADLVVTMGGVVRFVDVAVTDPTSTSAVRKGSDTTPCKAADIEATRIRSKYRGARYTGVNGALVDASAVVPFVVETTGRVGKDANAFLNLFREGGHWQRSTLMGVISATCARYAGKMMANAGGVHHQASRNTRGNSANNDSEGDGDEVLTAPQPRRHPH